MQAASPDWRKLWHASEAALLASNVADAAVSWGHYESNPVLGRGPFGVRQASIKIGLVSAVILVEHAVRKPRRATVFNFIAAGLTAGAVVQNERVLARQ